jgi:hypothetical protein
VEANREVALSIIEIQWIKHAEVATPGKLLQVQCFKGSDSLAGFQFRDLHGVKGIGEQAVVIEVID